ncbi:putative sugar O-methyltransferase [Sulfurimonas sp.]|nr:putative sugar O-methyltransferase [Sulfurimonas sp.]
MIANNIDDIKTAIEKLIELREKQYKKHVTRPSVIWKKWLQMLGFIREFSNDRLSDIRLHTGFGFFLGSNWSTCYYEKNEIELGIKEVENSQYIKDYHKLTKELSKEFFCSEIDVNRELISISYNDKYINEDVLRFQSTISNLSCLKNKNIKRYLEIGAGYGGLCNQFNKLFKPEQVIVIDHPEVLFWSIVYTYINNKDAKIQIVTDLSEDIIEDADFVFISAFLTDIMKGYNVDLLVNENSFCEMTEEQINYYFDTVSFDLMYSNNRNRQFMNSEVNSLNNIILNKYIVKPEPSYYKKYYSDDLNLHNLKYHFFASDDSNNLPNFKYENLSGLTIRTKH